jgi:hypothetical protein
LYADEKQNAVFIRRSLDDENNHGATLRGTAGVDNTFKGLALNTFRLRLEIPQPPIHRGYIPTF